MAEGDSIRRLVARLHSRYAGAVVAAAEFRRGGEIPPRFAGDTLLSVQARGKHILMRFAGGRTVHSHLRMQGHWRGHPAGWRPRPGERVAAWFDFAGAGVLAAHDMPVLDLVATSAEDRVVGHLGPDILGDSWPAGSEQAAARIAAAPERMIRSALLDQRNLCGIGNLWAVESLFIAGVWPHRPAGDTDVAKVLDVAGRMMRQGLRTGTQSTTGVLRRGETHWVYGRYRRPCRRCGTPIAFVAAGGDPYERETWWCPHCQR